MLAVQQFVVTLHHLRIYLGIAVFNFKNNNLEDLKQTVEQLVKSDMGLFITIKKNI